MLKVNEDQFELLVSDAIDAIPEKYFKKIKNVVFMTADEPTPEQIQKLQLLPGHSLFGLYEGIPLTSRNSGYNLVLPDKITIFRLPMLNYCKDEISLKRQVHKTVWHEVAHYFGLSHEAMDKLGGI